MKSKKLGIALLALLALVVTSGTFAYWASSVTGDAAVDNASVTIGSGNAVTTTVTLGGPTPGGSAALIPTNYATPGTEDTATLTYSVDWDADSGEAGTGFAGTLAVTFGNKVLGTLTEAQIDAMFTFTATSGTGAISEAGSNTVIITVVFANEPATQAIYDQVAAGSLTFDITFTVTVD